MLAQPVRTGRITAAIKEGAGGTAVGRKRALLSQGARSIVPLSWATSNSSPLRCHPEVQWGCNFSGVDQSPEGDCLCPTAKNPTRDTWLEIEINSLLTKLLTKERTHSQDWEWASELREACT